MVKWKQFHMDGPNQGFALIRTSETLEPKWNVEIGHVGYGSPVIGADNTIYIGTLAGELVAINPDGTIKWRRAMETPGRPRFAGTITGSPAIGNDGNIYVISTANYTIRDHRENRTTKRQVRRSTLFSVDPLGNIRWSYQFPANASPLGIGGYTMSSPKVWGEQEIYIFVPVIYRTTGHAIELIIVDASGTALQRIDIASYPIEPVIGEGHSLGDVLDAIWDFISSPVDFDTSGVSGGPSLEEQFGFPEPTIAIVDFGSFKDQPLIIIEDSFKTVSAFRFEAPILVPLWSKVSKKARFRTTPAAFPNGIITIGDIDGTLSIYDVEKGTEIWKPWYKADKKILAPAVSFGRQIFFVADKKVTALDSHSELWKQTTLQGRSLSAPALSANSLYISATDGFYRFSFDLSSVTKNEDIRGGISSPSIGNDGTLYVMDLQKKLWAI